MIINQYLILLQLLYTAHITGEHEFGKLAYDQGSYKKGHTINHIFFVLMIAQHDSADSYGSEDSDD
jgi:hypothetical protein